MIILTWLVLSLVVGFIGTERKIGFWGAFGVSLLLSPIIGLIITLVSKDFEKEKREKELLETQRRTATALEQNQSLSSADELSKLVGLKEKGDITQIEFEHLKAKIIK